MLMKALVCITVLLAFSVVLAQEQSRQTGVLRLRVRVRANDDAPLRALQRKRFFLIRGTLEQHRNLLEAIDRQPLATRECYYKNLRVSEALIDWLKQGDCESVYCRAIEQEFVSGPKAVPEFKDAFDWNRREFGSDEIARQWLTTNLAPNVRDGFYRDRKQILESLLKQAGGTVHSVMTDRNGTAYFTDLQTGTYVLSNLIPAEIGQTLAIWNCEVQVKPGDLASEKPYFLSNGNERSVKCVAISKPVPACNTD